MSSPNNPVGKANLRKRLYVPIVRRTFDPRVDVLASTDFRDPNTNQYYDYGTIWHNTTDDRFFILARITANLGKWLLITGGGAGVVTNLRADDGNIASPNLGIIDIDGNVVANATHAQPLFTRADVANTVDIDLQLATTVTPTPGDTNDVGVASFNENQFQIDGTSGMVSLAGSTSDGPILSIETDDGAPNVVADANGAVQILGGTGIDVTGQGPGNTVTVSLSGGGSAIDSVGVDFNTAPGTDPVVPDANGLITVVGDTVANATNSGSPVATHSRAANEYNIEVQVAADRTGAPGDKDDAGLASFDDRIFEVDTDGYVSFADYQPKTSFTPGLQGGTTPGSPTITVQAGWYTIFGPFVNVQFEVTWTAAGGAAGDIEITNFPVTFDSSGLNRNPIGTIWVEDPAFPAGTTYCVALGKGGTTTAVPYACGTSTTPAVVQFSSTGTIHGNITFTRT